MIFYTLADAASEIKSVIDGGTCTMPTAYSRINQAMRRIMNRPKKPLHIRRLIRFYTYKDIITLPHEVDRILHYTMDGVPAPLFSQAYEFVSGGPGELDGCDTCIAGKYLEDLGSQFSLMFDVPSRSYPYSSETSEGESPPPASTSSTEGFSMEEYISGTSGSEAFTQADLARLSANPELSNVSGDQEEFQKYQPFYSGLRIVALSTEASDRDKSVYIVGRNNKNEPLGPSNTGAELKISQWDGGIEGNFIYNEDVEGVPYTLANIHNIT
jgi:hypothetical protein